MGEKDTSFRSSANCRTNKYSAMKSTSEEIKNGIKSKEKLNLKLGKLNIDSKEIKKNK